MALILHHDIFISGTSFNLKRKKRMSLYMLNEMNELCFSYSWLTGSGGFASSGGLRMLFINLHVVNKVTVASIFAKHRLNFVVIFRKND